MTTKTLMLGKRNQLTLPREFVPAQTVTFRAEKKDNGMIILEPQITIPASQAYFWTKRWQKGEKQVDKEIDEGKLSPPMTADKLIAEMNRHRKQKNKRQRK